MQDKQTLDQLYQQTIDDQRAYLMKLQDDFNKKCDEAKEKTEAKLKEIPEDKKEEREAILMIQKQELEEALHTLKEEIDQSTRQTMKKLESIVHQKEELILLDLEKQMASL